MIEDKILRKAGCSSQYKSIEILLESSKSELAGLEGEIEILKQLKKASCFIYSNLVEYRTRLSKGQIREKELMDLNASDVMILDKLIKEAFTRYNEACLDLRECYAEKQTEAENSQKANRR